MFFKLPFCIPDSTHTGVAPPLSSTSLQVLRMDLLSFLPGPSSPLLRGRTAQAGMTGRSLTCPRACPWGEQGEQGGDLRQQAAPLRFRTLSYQFPQRSQSRHFPAPQLLLVTRWKRAQTASPDSFSPGIIMTYLEPGS